MIDTIFNGEKTLLIETEDFYSENINKTVYGIVRARTEGYGLILIVTSLPFLGIPRQIRELMNSRNTDYMRAIRIHV